MTEDKWPCMHVECDKEAIFGVQIEGGGTILCHEHLWPVLDSKEHYGYLGQYRLDELEE